MNRSLVLFAIFFSLLLIVGVPYFLHERGFTPWMSYSEMDAYCCVENIIMNKEPLPMEGVSQDSDRGFFEEIAIRAGRES